MPTSSFFRRASLVSSAIATACFVFSAIPAMAGEGWYLQNSGTSNSFKDVDFFNENSGTAVGFGIVQRTGDAGKTWTPASIPAGVAAVNFYGVEAVEGTNIGYAVGSNGTIIHTTDGKNWSQQVSGVTGILYEVACTTSGATCWAVGDGGTILKTTNSGTTWTPQTSGTTTRLDDVAVTQPFGSITAYVVGLGGTILKTTNGTSWTPQTSGVTTELMAVSFSDPSHGYAVGTGRTIIRTVNGGSTWTPHATTLVPSTHIMYDVTMLDETHVMIGSDLGSVLALHTDGGWFLYTMPNNKNYEGVYYGSDARRYVVGTSGSIARYDNVSPAAPTNLHFVTPADNNTSDTTPTFTWTASSGDGESGIAGYRFLVSGVSTDIGMVTTYTPTAALTDGVHTAFVRALDGVGNESAQESYSFTIDTQPPTVGTVSPTSATAGAAVTFVVLASDNINVATCTLRIDGVDVGAMTNVGGGSFSRSHTFTAAGGYAVAAACADNSHSLVTGAAVSVTVATGTTPPPTTPPPTTPPPTTPPPTTPPPTTPPPTTAVPGALLKFACPSGARVDHPCKAVYFYGTDGKRHAFSNDKVYFTWYGDFSGVVTVSQSFLSSLPLGKNITYRPGIKLVKFQTLNTVYAVAARGVLRAVASESVATALYGSAWAGGVDDISDAFFVDYTFGANINSASDYSPTAEASAITSVGANL